MNLLRFNLFDKCPDNQDIYNCVFNPESTWISVGYLFREFPTKAQYPSNIKLSRLADRSHRVNNYPALKIAGRSNLRLAIHPHMWSEIIDRSHLKVLWAMVIHRDYLREQIGSLLTSGSLIPEYTQIHVRSEFAYYKYQSPTLRNEFVKKIQPRAEELGVKVYEKDDFQDLFVDFTKGIKTLKEMKQLKQTIINELRDAE